MSRKTKIVHVPEPSREARVPEHDWRPGEVRHLEQPPMDLPIAWNFDRMDKGGKFKCSLKLLDKYADALVRLEGKSVNQLMEKAHNHPMSTHKLSVDAKARLDALELEEETLFQLDLGTPARLWGVLERNVFHVIWLDAEHDVYVTR